MNLNWIWYFPHESELNLNFSFMNLNTVELEFFFHKLSLTDISIFHMNLNWDWYFSSEVELDSVFSEWTWITFEFFRRTWNQENLNFYLSNLNLMGVDFSQYLKPNLILLDELKYNWTSILFWIELNLEFLNWTKLEFLCDELELSRTWILISWTGKWRNFKFFK